MRERLQSLSAEFRRRMAGRLTSEGEGPILPVRCERPENTQKLAAQLLDAGFLVGAIRPPTVPQGTSRLRICLTASCGASEIDRLASLPTSQMS